MLEHHELRKQLQQRNQELATALYEHDAAVRVIARLARERDQARQVIRELSNPPVWHAAGFTDQLLPSTNWSQSLHGAPGGSLECVLDSLNGCLSSSQLAMLLPRERHGSHSCCTCCAQNDLQLSATALVRHCCTGPVLAAVSAASASGLQALETLQAAGPQPMANGKRAAEEMEPTERPDPKRVSCVL